MKKKSLFLFILSAFFVGSFLVSNAQESKVVTVATVNIYDSKLVSQEQNNFKISFDLSNRENAQPDVRYSISLIEQTEQSQNLIDEKVYEEKLSLNENETLKKEITYQAPTYLKGKYNLVLFAKNSSGMMLAISPVGEVELTGTGEYIQIDSPTCYLTIEGDEKETRYTLTQGVDISKTETLLANCEVKNNYSKSVSVLPKFTTHYRTTYGKTIETENFSYEKVTISANGKVIVSYEIPKPEAPQAYDAVMEMIGGNGEISNRVAFHYVLQGSSATIQNVRLDKDYYQKGETAKLSFYWSPSADSFPNSRASANIQQQEVKVELSLTGKDKKSCAKAYDSLLKGSNLDINLAIIEDCQDPLITVKLKDGQGNILDMKELKIESKNIPQKEQMVEKKTDGTLVILLSVLALTLCLLLGIFIYKKRTSNSALMLFFAIILSSVVMFAGAEEARADTFYLEYWVGCENLYEGDNCTLWRDHTVTVNLNKSTYARGETITYSGTIFSHECTNTTLGTRMKVTINGSTVLAFDGTIPGQTSTIFNGSGTAQSSPGTYQAVFEDESVRAWTDEGGYQEIVHKVSHPISYTVQAPPSCSLSFSPSSGLTAPANFNANISYSNATSASYSCTGPFPGSGALNISTTNIPFNGVPAGTENCTISVSGPGGSGSCSASVVINPAPIVINGSCGTAAKTWPASFTNYSTAALCSSGTASPSNPAFPAIGGQASWTCLGSGGGSNATCIASRDVVPTVSLTANPTTVNYGSPTTLTWTTTGNFEICESFGGGGTGPGWTEGWANSTDLITSGGSAVVYPHVSKIYTINCWDSWDDWDNDIDEISASVLVTVNPSVNGVCGTASRTYASTETSFGAYSICASPGGSSPATPSFPLAGSSSTWTCLGQNGGADSGICTAIRQAGPSCGTANRTYAAADTSWGAFTFCSSGSASPASPIFPSQGSSTSWTCTSGSSVNCSANRLVPVAPAPTLDFSANPQSITSGGSSSLIWTTTNADSCYGSGGGWDGWKSNTSSSSLVFPSSTTTYFLECWNSNGVSTGIKSTTVVVSAIPISIPTLDFSANPQSITSGGSSSLIWTTTNADSCYGSGGGWDGWKSNTSSSSLVFPSSTTTYFLECWNSNGVSTGIKSTTVVVSAIPTSNLTVDITGSGNGTVTGTGGLNCSSDCTRAYATGTLVSLTPSSSSGSVFGSWSGCDSTSGQICNITMNSSRTVSVSFNASCTPNNSCAAETCIGYTCRNNCGFDVPGTKNCSGADTGGYIEVQP